MTGVALIAVDWGSSGMRAYRMSHAGEVLAERASDVGASRLNGKPAEFETALRNLLGDWLDTSQPAPPIVACGMVGSAHGWQEAPYVRCPASLADLQARSIVVDGARGLRLRIVPGLLYAPTAGPSDVMRGEETKVAGLLAGHPEFAARSCVVLPGTHSKWVSVVDGRVASFATRMTGELYAVLCAHSVLGRLMEPSTGFHRPAFESGVDLAQRAGGADLAHLLFSVRTRGLAGELAPTVLADYLSGILIGSEVVAALATAPADEALVLIGEPILCQRYRDALELLRRAPTMAMLSTAPLGLWSFARQAGWLLPDA